jgi:hypothetical protein
MCGGVWVTQVVRIGPCYSVHMKLGFVETDWERNIKQVSPFLGMLLIAAFALFLYTVFTNAVHDLTQAVHTEAPRDVEGTLRLVDQGPHRYEDTVSFRSTVQGATSGATTYVTVACFQDEKLVYQRSAQQGVSFYLYDQYERDLEWDGGTASCSATLMYRTAGAGKIDVYVLDALSFNVDAVTE